MRENEFRETQQQQQKTENTSGKSRVPVNDDILRKQWNLLASAENAQSKKSTNKNATHKI